MKDNDNDNDDKSLDILRRVNEIEKSRLYPLNKHVLGPLERRGGEEDRLTSLPFVFMLGNHSSGKSTFINHVLGRSIQVTGVAPTDDGFTIIAPGEDDLNQDGPALVGNPDMGFAGLRSFGPALIQKTTLKIRSNLNGINFMLVDSPGMIDSPTSHTINAADVAMMMEHQKGRILGQSEISDRGYDFVQATRWFAERADVILLFFDPDKPGTTGETLSILTSALVGMDHKMHIILNKVDQFRKIHDFARAYGSLCWNLSKVIPRKDLPRIYTMCIPAHERQERQEHVAPMEATHSDSFRGALAELESTRTDVVNEVLRAPERRVDNVITRLYDSTRLLQMHALVMETVRDQYARELWHRRAIMSGTVVTGGALSIGVLSAGVSWQLAFGLGAFTAIGAVGLQVQSNKLMRSLRDVLISDASLNDVFKLQYGREIADGDEFVLSLWKRVKPQLQLSIQTLGIDNVPKIKASDLAALDKIVRDDIPTLRRKAAPTDKSYAHRIANMFRPS